MLAFTAHHAASAHHHRPYPSLAETWLPLVNGLSILSGFSVSVPHCYQSLPVKID